MYDWPEFRWATDAWWQGLTRHCGLNLELARQPDHTAAWRQPGLIFSQTCGYPFTHEFRGLLRYLATPHYAAPGCEGPLYCSQVFARQGADLQNPGTLRWAVNSTDSMSGWLALRLFAAARWPGFRPQPQLTGSHRASLRALREGGADVCAIDAVCAGLVQHHKLTDLDGLEPLGLTPKVPGLPYVTRAGNVEKLRAGLKAAMADESLQEARAALLIRGLSVLPEGSYDRILELESQL
jgi:ABC-type phosphate/phosphonate transport system substrate-binding protein